MTVVICRSNAASLPKASADRIPVLLYGVTDRSGAAYIGNGVHGALRHFRVPTSVLAFDLLTIALAVTAADTFVSRDDAPDRWSRTLRLDVALSDPTPWHAVTPKLQQALGFLSGDSWELTFVSGGTPPPFPQHRRTVNTVDLHPSIDCVSLFSGGMDSTIGLLDLKADGRHPLLVSHAYNKDGDLQKRVLSLLSSSAPRFAVNLSPGRIRGMGPEITMRARSFNFLALAVVAAAMVKAESGKPDLEVIIPENGFIALNVPLTPRRVGSLSTRTTHPYFIAIMQSILDDVGETVRLRNPYEFKTKGEMLRECRDPVSLSSVASETMSCSNWKRKGIACGRCVPCLIRRASFASAGVRDRSTYQTPMLRWTGPPNKLDDLLAVTSAIHRKAANPKREMARRSGSLPPTLPVRQGYDEVVQRGLQEMADYLAKFGLL